MNATRVTSVVTAATESISYRRFTVARREATSAQVRYIPHLAKRQRTVMCIGTATEVRAAVWRQITDTSVTLVGVLLNIWRFDTDVSDDHTGSVTCQRLDSTDQKMIQCSL